MPLAVSLSVLFVVGVVGLALWIRCKRKRSRATLQKHPMMAVVHAGSNDRLVSRHMQSSASRTSLTSQVELVSHENGIQPAPALGGRSRMGSRRAKTATGREDIETSTYEANGANPAGGHVPVVVSVPLPDLEKPIVAVLDANHQIVSTREYPEDANQSWDEKTHI